MRIINLAILVLFLTSGCYDIVTDHYATRNQAEVASLFKRGWLPNLIPPSASDISTRNDLDANRSEGEFKFDVKESVEFIEKLSPYSNQNLPVASWQSILSTSKENGYEIYEYTFEQSKWIFVINNKTGHVRYLMWRNNKNN